MRFPVLFIFLGPVFGQGKEGKIYTCKVKYITVKLAITNF